MKTDLLKWVLVSVFALSMTFCTKTSESNSKEGKIKIYVCSRGCYQYLISIQSTSGDTLFYPVNLPEGYKQLNWDGGKITLTYDLLSTTTQIYKPAPDDSPVPLFQVKNISITSLKGE